jgi:hypothetical protein
MSTTYFSFLFKMDVKTSGLCDDTHTTWFDIEMKRNDMIQEAFAARLAVRTSYKKSFRLARLKIDPFLVGVKIKSK